MHLAFGVSAQQLDIKSVSIDCPVCKRVNASATAKDLRETITLFHLIPIFLSTTTFVTCPCGTLHISSLKARDLAGMDSAFGARYLNVRISPILRTMVLGGLFVWILPVFGAVWMACTCWWVWKYPGWMRTLSVILMFLSLVSSAALLIPSDPEQPLKTKHPVKHQN